MICKQFKLSQPEKEKLIRIKSRGLVCRIGTSSAVGLYAGH